MNSKYALEDMRFEVPQRGRERNWLEFGKEKIPGFAYVLSFAGSNEGGLKGGRQEAGLTKNPDSQIK